MADIEKGLCYLCGKYKWVELNKNWSREMLDTHKERIKTENADKKMKHLH